MNIFKEFAKAGLIKSEQYLDPEETTTTGNIAVGISPFDEPEKKDEEGEKITVEEYIEMIECAQKLNAAYKKMTGNDLHELYCPKCKIGTHGPDLSQAPDHDGNQSASDNTPNGLKGNYGEF